MAEPVEVAVEKALLDRAISFAAAQSPSLTISLPNVTFTPPAATQNAQWLRASLLPAPSVENAIGAGQAQHYGIMQIDVMYGLGSGEYAPGRIASAIVSYFSRGTELTQDGFTVIVWKRPYRGPLIRQSGDVWSMLPVSIPYICFS